MIQVFLGYRNVMRHVLYVAPPGHPQIVEQFCPEVEEWCKANLTGEAYPVYQRMSWVDENGCDREGARWEFCFEHERDIVMFKLFWIGG